MTATFTPAPLAADARARLEAHARAALDWTARAQDVTADGGVSSGYTALKGWTTSFPETTGYLIPTVLDAAAMLGDERWYARANRMGQWLLGVQHADGAFPGGLVDGDGSPSVFNTGQILYGLVRMYRETREDVFLAAAQRAGEWLVSVQDADGAWRRHDFMDAAHVYNTRTAWPLLLLHEETGDAALREAALRHVDWAVAQADESGFFAHAAFAPDCGHRESLRRTIRGRNLPFFYTKASLHTIAYTIQGLLESSWLLGHEAGEAAAIRAARALSADAADGRLRGWYGPGWRPEARSLCLTGAAQMAIVWLRLAQHGQDDLVVAADRTLDAVTGAQRLTHRRAHKRGGLAGSAPVWGLYLPFRWPNWAPKFAVDAYLLRLALAGHGKDEIREPW